MLSERKVNINGTFVPWDQATVHTMSHSFGRGFTLFEVTSVHDTADGPAVFRPDEHALRFFNTARLLNVELPMSVEEFQEAMLLTVRENGVRQGVVKVLAYHSQIALEILPPQGDLDVAVFAVDPQADFGRAPKPLEDGTTLAVATWRKLHPQTVPVEAKVAANYLNGLMARVEARSRGFEDAVMLDTQGYLAEGGTEAVFLVKDGTLMAPALGTILQSISRKSVLEIAEAEGIPYVERRLLPQQLHEADEVFIANSLTRVFPVRTLEARTMPQVPGPISARLLEVVRRIEARQDERFKQWLRLV